MCFRTFRQSEGPRRTSDVRYRRAWHEQRKALDSPSGSPVFRAAEARRRGRSRRQSPARRLHARDRGGAAGSPLCFRPPHSAGKRRAPIPHRFSRARLTRPNLTYRHRALLTRINPRGDNGKMDRSGRRYLSCVRKHFTRPTPEGILVIAESRSDRVAQLLMLSRNRPRHELEEGRRPCRGAIAARLAIHLKTICTPYCTFRRPSVGVR